MKKMLCLVLCLVMACFTMVACSEDPSDEARKELDKIMENNPIKEVPEMEFDFYIITEEETLAADSGSIATVTSGINDFLSAYKTTLDIHFLTAEEYEETVLNDVTKTGDDRADIILVVGEEMFDTLHSSDSLANIKNLMASTDYGMLNTQISNALLDATVVKETEVDNGVEYISDNRYFVPNNHIVGEYKLVLVNEAAVLSMQFTDAQIAAMNSPEAEEVTLLKNRVEKWYGDKHNYTLDECIKFVTGTYADIAKYESQGYRVNIESVPTVSRADAYASGFAIVKHPYETEHEQALATGADYDGTKIATYQEYYDRCMEVIYLLNTNIEFRNLLQYGEEPIHYRLRTDEETGIQYIEVVESEKNVYKMNILYTGDVFKAYFNQDDWTSDDYAYGTKQNADAVFAE